MLIRLEQNGRVIHEIASASLKEELVIGRSHSCTWPMPKEDTVASSKHAALFKKGGSLWLKDLGSTNGTFHNGKRIERKKLVVGDKISLGNCVLSVDHDRGRDSKSLSEILVLTGKSRGQKKPLKPPVFTIGSDPSSSLVFLDMLVSRRHAEILIKEDGSCWIRDLGSKNGTSVNELPLRDDKERLLKDGDRIACSHFELEFHDGAIKRSNKQTWLRIAILGLTLLAGLSAYWAFQHVKPSAEAFIKGARRLAAQEAFTPALAQVEKAVNARHAASNQVAIEELRRLISVWRNTLIQWQKAQKALETGEWVSASRALGMLQASKREAWEWNTKASGEKERALQAKSLLDALLQTEALLSQESYGFGELTACQTDVTRSLDDLNKAGKVPAYLNRLAEQLTALHDRLAGLVEASRVLEEALDRLKEPMPPYAEVARVVEQTLASQEPALKRHAAVLSEPMQALANSSALLGEAVQAARRLEFSKALADSFKIPGADACSIDPRLSQARQSLEKAEQTFKNKVGQLAVLIGEIERRVGLEGETPPCLAALQNDETFRKALGCDVIDHPLPKRSRTEPIAEYDRVFGTEEFYAHLSALPDPLDAASQSDLPFVSQLTQARQLCQKAEQLLAFLGQPENRWLMAEQVARQADRAKGFLAARDALLKTFAAQASSAEGRDALIAGGIVVRLTTAPHDIQIKGKKPEEWVADELKARRKELLRLNEEYSLAAPKRQIEIRTEILRAGLPGDPIVRRMWALKDSASSSS